MATTSGTASWGVSGSATGVTGVITHIDVDDEGALAPEYNELGQVIKQTLYDHHKTANVTVEVPANTAPPAAGAAATVAGVAGYVVRSRVVEDNRAYRHIEVTVEAYTNCTATTAAGGTST